MSELVFEAMQEEEGGVCAGINPIIPAGSTKHYNLMGDPCYG